MHQYIVLTLGIGNIFVDQLSTFHVFEKAHIVLASKSSSLPSNLRSLMNRKTQFKAASQRYLNTHFFYSVEEFVMFKNNSSYCMCMYCWSQWLHSLRHIQSSTTQTLESWVQILLKARICVHIFLCCAVLCR